MDVSASSKLVEPPSSRCEPTGDDVSPTVKAGKSAPPRKSRFVSTSRVLAEEGCDDTAQGTRDALEKLTRMVSELAQSRVQRDTQTDMQFALMQERFAAIDERLATLAQSG